MEIKAIEVKSIEYACTFTLADVQLAKDDPYSFGEKVREHLLALDPKPVSNGNGQHSNRVHLNLGTKRAAKKTGKPKAPKAGTHKRTKAKFGCAECGKDFTSQGFLDRHNRQIHGQAATAPEAPDWTPASAAAAAE